VLQFPANRSNLDIEDLNNGAMVWTIRGKSMTEMYQDLYKDALEVWNEHVSKLHGSYM
jgi:hypothetical protein